MLAPARGEFRRRAQGGETTATQNPTKPGWYKVTLAVRRDGYRPIEHILMHDRFRQRVIVFLVRTEQAG